MSKSKGSEDDNFDQINIFEWHPVMQYFIHQHGPVVQFIIIENNEFGYRIFRIHMLAKQNVLSLKDYIFVGYDKSIGKLPMFQRK